MLLSNERLDLLLGEATNAGLLLFIRVAKIATDMEER